MFSSATRPTCQPRHGPVIRVQPLFYPLSRPFLPSFREEVVTVTLEDLRVRRHNPRTEYRLTWANIALSQSVDSAGWVAISYPVLLNIWLGGGGGTSVVDSFVR